MVGQFNQLKSEGLLGNSRKTSTIVVLIMCYILALLLRSTLLSRFSVSKFRYLILGIKVHIIRVINTAA